MRVLSVLRWTEDGTPIWTREPEPGELERLAQYETAGLERDVAELYAVAQTQNAAANREQLKSQARFLEARIEAIRAARLALDQRERRRLEDRDDAMKKLAKPDIEVAQERFRELRRLMNDS